MSIKTKIKDNLKGLLVGITAIILVLLVGFVPSAPMYLDDNGEIVHPLSIIEQCCSPIRWQGIIVVIIIAAVLIGIITPHQTKENVNKNKNQQQIAR